MGIISILPAEPSVQFESLAWLPLHVQHFELYNVAWLIRIAKHTPITFPVTARLLEHLFKLNVVLFAWAAYSLSAGCPS